MPAPFAKICGMTRPGDIRLALSLGARYVGCVVDVPRSPRTVTPSGAAELASAASGALVAVVVDMPRESLCQLLADASPAALQLHGSEPPALISTLKREFPRVHLWRALAANPDDDPAHLLASAREYLDAGADAILLDASVRGVSGGTGTPCDWDLAARVVAALPLPVILAGGLTPDNIAAAIQRVHPAGIDLSSGVEISPGIKCPQRLRALFQALEGL